MQKNCTKCPRFVEYRFWYRRFQMYSEGELMSANDWRKEDEQTCASVLSFQRQIHPKEASSFWPRHSTHSSTARSLSRLFGIRTWSHDSCKLLKAKRIAFSSDPQQPLVEIFWQILHPRVAYIHCSGAYSPRRNMHLASNPLARRKHAMPLQASLLVLGTRKRHTSHVDSTPIDPVRFDLDAVVMPMGDKVAQQLVAATPSFTFFGKRKKTFGLAALTERVTSFLASTASLRFGTEVAESALGQTVSDQLGCNVASESDKEWSCCRSGWRSVTGGEGARFVNDHFQLALSVLHVHLHLREWLTWTGPDDPIVSSASLATVSNRQARSDRMFFAS
ncbi:unnamed protein product [Protopolystoma xenopodis]|uniref:Uncharacterized protein n=1 Tax=Protopolystoma xenopodis TaxID=117903 RepID=A0A3S5B6N3_9PLAT|nr:unnamed protein product [Protopolystoma xenopodis]